MGEASLYLFKDSKLHHKSDKYITIYYGFFLLDLKNPTQLMAQKSDERRSQKCPAKFLSLMDSLHKKWLCLYNYSSFPFFFTP
jgi:hypothetical protein